MSDFWAMRPCSDSRKTGCPGLTRLAIGTDFTGPSLQVRTGFGKIDSLREVTTSVSKIGTRLHTSFCLRASSYFYISRAIISCRTRCCVFLLLAIFYSAYNEDLFAHFIRILLGHQSDAFGITQVVGLDIAGQTKSRT